jgi:hypothetical protein
MNVTVEESGQNLKEKLTSLLSRCSADGPYVRIEISDGTMTYIDPTKEWEVEIGVDYISIEQLVVNLGPVPSAPRIIPFTSVRSIYVVD